MLVAPPTTRFIVPRPVCTCTFLVLTTRRVISQGPLLSAIFAAYTARAEVLSRPDVDASACPNFVFVVEGEVCPCVIVWRSVYVTVCVCDGACDGDGVHWLGVARRGSTEALGSKKPLQTTWIGSRERRCC